MQEYKNDKLVVRYDPAICIHRPNTWLHRPATQR